MGIRDGSRVTAHDAAIKGRAAGEQIEHPGDGPGGVRRCLIGSIAIRAGVAVLHNDSDFDVLARHTGLRVDPLD